MRNERRRQVLDMTTALDSSEDGADPDAGVCKHAAAGNALPKPAGSSGPRSYFAFLQAVRGEGVHGQAFGYKTVNTVRPKAATANLFMID